MKKVAILGGGISGLSTAYFLHEQGFDVTVFEKEKIPGGVIKTYQKDGFICELGPNTVLINNEGILNLLTSSKLIDKIISPDATASGNRFVLKNNRMIRVPISPFGFITTKLLNFKEKLRILREPFIPKHSSNQPLSLEEFVINRFGKAFYQNFIVPFVTGIYAGNPKRMSAKHSFSLLYQLEQQHGSVLKGFIYRMKQQKKVAKREKLPKQKMFTFRNGLQTLPFHIAELLGDKYWSHTKVTSIHFNSTYSIEYEKNGKFGEMQADIIINSLPANTTASLLGKSNPTLTQLLNKLEYVPVSVFHFGFDKEKIEFSTPGFGVLPLAEEKRSYLGVLFNSRTFLHMAPAKTDLFTVIVGGSRSPELTKMKTEGLEKMVLTELKELLSISSDPIFKHNWSSQKAIPQYGLNHELVLQAVKQFEEDHKDFYMVGNYLEGVSVSDCVNTGYELALKISSKKN